MGEDSIPIPDIEDAAASLRAELAAKPGFIAVGIGGEPGRPKLIIYWRSAQDRWGGGDYGQYAYRAVEHRVCGTPRPVRSAV
jgi:hypothetical protein